MIQFCEEDLLNWLLLFERVGVGTIFVLISQPPSFRFGMLDWNPVIEGQGMQALDQ